jgi:3'-5' exoribonuclease
MPIVPGESFCGTAMIESIEFAETRSGSRYTSMRLRLVGGEDHPAKYWEGHLRAFARGAVAEVTGRVDEWEGRAQIVIQNIAPHRGKLTARDFLPRSPFDPADRLARLFELVEKCCKGPERSLALHLLGKHREAFLAAPGGITMHHGTIGGLAEHTLAVARLSLNHYFAYEQIGYDVSRIDLSAMIAGAAVHDIGKVFEYVYDEVIDYEQDNLLEQHVARGHAMFSGALGELGLELDDALRQVDHIILSHHGQAEFGAPVEPLTIEALIVHRADQFDVFHDVAREVLASNRDQPGRLTARDGRLWNNRKRLWRPRPRG